MAENEKARADEDVRLTRSQFYRIASEVGRRVSSGSSLAKEVDVLLREKLGPCRSLFHGFTCDRYDGHTEAGENHVHNKHPRFYVSWAKDTEAG